jgi:hypothetical protein
MKKLVMALMAVVLSLSLSGGMAFANTCPKLIKQGREAAAKMDANDAKVKAAVAKLDEAEQLHKDGKHADSVKTANEANAMLGVK